VLFFIPAFSLAGFPPLSGFWAKMILIRASLETDHFVLAGVAAVVGLLTVYSMVKIWSEAFWKPQPAAAGGTAAATSPMDAWMLLPIAAMAALTVLIGLSPELLFQLARTAADELLDPGAYVYTVIGNMR
jgi:multicomponent Na+:H+ antiporter subunit D